MVLAIATLWNLEVHQIDVKTVFLNGDLEEEIYIEQLADFSTSRKEKKICGQVKSLYDLNQTPK